MAGKIPFEEKKDKVPPPPQPKFEAYRFVMTLVDSPPLNATEMVKIAYLERRGNDGYFYYCADHNTGRAAWYDELSIEYPAVDPEMPVRRQMPDLKQGELINPRRNKYTMPDYLNK